MNFSRKEFLKITVYTGLAALLNSCGIETEQESEKKKSPLDSSENKKPNPIFKKRESEHVVYITQEDAAYGQLNQGFNKCIQKLPFVIALCENEKGVQEAVLFAKENGLKISVKSGGHCFEGFSNNDDGLVVNLSKLNAVTFDDTNIIVGPGCKLGDLYDIVLKANRILPAGSCSGVGVGGLTLGGGYGFFSRKYGLTCDSILELEMVTASGELINSNDHPELLWALKGGGNGNFGIVTQFKFRTYEAPAFFQSNRFKAHNLDTQRAEEILKCWFQVAEKLPNYCFAAFVLNGKNLTILITNFEPLTAETEELFLELAELTDSYKAGGKSNVDAALKVFGGQTSPILFKNASVGLYNSFDDISGFVSSVIQKVISSRGFIYQINTLGGNVNNQDFEKASCYAHRSCLFLSELQSYWQDEKKSESFLSQFKEIQNIFFEGGITKQYVNYPSINNPNYGNAYYGQNYIKLKEVKKMYDPEDVFSHKQSIAIT